MAFKMKNPSVMKMAKQAGAGMKMKAPMKMGHSPKKVMKGDGRAESSSFQMKEKAAMKMKKAAMKLKKESAMMLKKSAMEMKKASAMKDTVSLKTKLMNQIKAIGEGLGEFDRYFAAEKGNATLAGYRAYKKELERLRSKKETKEN